MKNLLKYAFLVSLTSFYPMVALATDAGAGAVGCPLGQNPTFLVISTFIICNINEAVIPLIFALALVMFIWGVVQFVLNSSEEAKKEQGRQFMLWGIIALTVMLCVWGIVNILANTFGINVRIIPQVHAPAG